MKKIISLMLTAVIALGLTACNKKDSDISEVRIAYFPNITHAQALVMKSEGLLEEKLDDEKDKKLVDLYIDRLPVN